MKNIHTQQLALSLVKGAFNRSLPTNITFPPPADIPLSMNLEKDPGDSNLNLR